MKNVLFVADVLDKIFGRPEAPAVFVGDLEAELLLDLPDDLHVVEIVEAEVLLEVGREQQLHTREEPSSSTMSLRDYELTRVRVQLNLKN